MSGTLEVVVEVAEPRGETPWPVAPVPPEGRLRLWAGTPDDAIGLVVFHLAHYNSLPSEERAGEGEPAEVLRALAGAEALIVPGGLLLTTDAGRVVAPGCCCGLEGWREWASLLVDGKSPWLGHDPSPWAERVEGGVRVWPDGGLGTVDRATLEPIDLPEGEFAAALGRAHADLRAFLARLGEWAAAIAPDEAVGLVDRFDRAFSVRAPLG